MRRKQILSILILSAMTTLYTMPLSYGNKAVKSNKKTTTPEQMESTEPALAPLTENLTESTSESVKLELVKNTTFESVATPESINMETSEIPVHSEGWLNANSNIRTQPDINSDIITTMQYGDKIEYCPYNDEWYHTEYNGQPCYIHNSLVSNTEIVKPNYTEYDCPYNKRMSYMPYQSITSKSSNQHKLQKIAYTGQFGVRQVNGRYCIAVGSAYTTAIGTYIDLILENGTVIPCVLGDCKADIHTDASNRISGDGSLVEFIVDNPSLGSMVRKMGQLEYACDEWNSKIIKIRVYDMKEDF